MQILIPILLGVVVVVGLTFCWFGFGIASRFHCDRKLRARTVGQGKLALTYDDGPGPETTPVLLDLLAEQDVKATFFLIGDSANAAPEIVSRMKQEGHTVCWHTQNHRNQWKTNPFSAILDLLVSTGAGSQLASSSKVFRPPYGKLTLGTVATCFAKGWRIISWTHPSGDTFATLPNPQVITNKVKQDGGGVVLMHDMDRKDPARPRFVLETTRQLIGLARREGWDFIHTPEDWAKVA